VASETRKYLFGFRVEPAALVKERQNRCFFDGELQSQPLLELDIHHRINQEKRLKKKTKVYFLVAERTIGRAAIDSISATRFLGAKVDANSA
jgi:hypothetical protein